MSQWTLAYGNSYPAVSIRGSRCIALMCVCMIGYDEWPSMVTHTQNLCSAFNPSKCTLTEVNTHPEQWAAIAAASGEKLGIRCLAQGSHLSHGIKGGENARCSLHPPTIPAGPEIRTHNLRLQVQRSIH